MSEHKVFRQKTVVEQVMEEIKSLVSTGQFKVNEKIPSEMELAERFGVSRPTIREAIKVFNYLGVFITRTGKGTYVSDRANISTEALTWALLLGSNEMQDLIELRELIESNGIRKLVSLFYENKIEFDNTILKLTIQIENMKNAIATNSKEELNQADFLFHLIIIQSNNNDVFDAIYNTLQSFMLQEMHKTHEEANDPQLILRDHQAILDGILTGDKKEAITAFNSHMQSRCFDIIRQIV